MENHEYPNRYAITLNGCDGATTFCMFLTPEHVGLLEQMVAATESVSRFSCMPRLSFVRSTEETERRYVEDKAEKLADADDEGGGE